LPDDDVMLARLASCPLEIWRRDIRKQVMPFFTLLADGRWHQKRMDAEIAHRNEVSEKRAAAAEIARAARSAKAMASPCKQPQTNAISSTETKPAKTLKKHDTHSANQRDVDLLIGGEPEPEPDKKNIREPSALVSPSGDGCLDLLPTASITRLKVNDDCQEAVSCWNAMAVSCGLPQVAKLSDSRRRLLLARLRDCGGMDGWKSAMDQIRASDFLRGITSRDGWTADFDFITRQSIFTKLMEGSYRPTRGNNRLAKSNAELLAEMSGGFPNVPDDPFTFDGEYASL
jgi:uncharacterized protein YdaU (DUF1376 family)